MLIRTFIIFLLIFSFSAHAKTEYRDVSLTVGIDKEVKIPKSPKNFIVDGTFRSFIRLQRVKGEKTLVFKPKKQGIGTLLLKHPETGKIVYEFHIDAKKIDLKKDRKEIAKLLRNISGIEVRIVNNRVVVDGEVIHPDHIRRIHSVLKLFPDSSFNMTTVSLKFYSLLAQKMEKTIGLPEVHVRNINKKFFVEGYVSSEKERAKALNIVQSMIPDHVVDEAEADVKIKKRRAHAYIDLIEVRPPPMAGPNKIIKVIVSYVEMNKNYEKYFDFNWAPNIDDGSKIQLSNGPRSPASVASMITATISNLFPKINWLTEHGKARTLQTSRLLVEDSQTGEVNSFSKVPYSSIGANGLSSTQFEDVGLKTVVTPELIGQRSDSVNLKVKFSVRTLSGMTAAGPLISSREITTKLTVRNGRSAAIGGLIGDDSGYDYNKLPANAPRNPIFLLKKSKAYRHNKSQFLVFLTPYIVSSASSDADKIRNRIKSSK